MSFLHDIVYWLKQSGAIIFFVVLFFYFAFNMFYGDRGFQKYVYLKKEVQYAQEMAEKYQQKKEYLDQEVKLLSPNNLDLDLLDERARDVLNLVGNGEFVILDEE